MKINEIKNSRKILSKIEIKNENSLPIGLFHNLVHKIKKLKSVLSSTVENNKIIVAIEVNKLEDIENEIRKINQLLK